MPPPWRGAVRHHLRRHAGPFPLPATVGALWLSRRSSPHHPRATFPHRTNIPRRKSVVTRWENGPGPVRVPTALFMCAVHLDDLPPSRPAARFETPESDPPSHRVGELHQGLHGPSVPGSSLIVSSWLFGHRPPAGDHSLAGDAFASLRFPGRDALFLGYLGTLNIPGEVVIIPNFILFRYLGWINTYQGLILPAAFSAFGTSSWSVFPHHPQLSWKTPPSSTAPAGSRSTSA